MRTVARRYAKALVDFAEGAKIEFNELMDVFKAIVNFFNDNRSLRKYFENPFISKTEKISFARELFNSLKIPNYMHNFLLLLVENRRVSLIDLIYEETLKEVNLRRNIAKGILKVAVDVDDGTVERLREVFKQKLGKDVIFDVIVDPSIIGGVVVELEGKVFDGSVVRNLERMKEKMIEG